MSLIGKPCVCTHDVLDHCAVGQQRTAEVRALLRDAMRRVTKA